jgi:hypothetical protein
MRTFTSFVALKMQDVATTAAEGLRERERGLREGVRVDGAADAVKAQVGVDGVGGEVEGDGVEGDGVEGAEYVTALSACASTWWDYANLYK